MKFKRQIGWEFDWYAVDSIGCVALFASGHAAVPGLIFEDESKYLKVINYFENLPDTTNARLSAFTKARRENL